MKRTKTAKALAIAVDAPPFTLSAKAVRLVADIAALAERFAIRMEQPDALLLRRANKIKSIRSSLAIEGNTLSEEQVSDILNGKPVVAPLRQIQEVKNGIAAYDLYRPRHCRNCQNNRRQPRPRVSCFHSPTLH